MAENKRTFEFKNVGPGLIQLNSGSKILKHELPTEGAKIDVTLTITESTEDGQSGNDTKRA